MSIMKFLADLGLREATPEEMMELEQQEKLEELDEQLGLGRWVEDPETGYEVWEAKEPN